jgi:hypothetical protein
MCHDAMVCCAQLVTALSAALLVGWATRRYVPAAAKPVYLIDTYTYKPPDRRVLLALLRRSEHALCLPCLPLPAEQGCCQCHSVMPR